MSGGSKYDPDRMSFEDLDLDDLDAVEEWLDHPVTRALHADLGRAFRSLPAGEQRAQLANQRSNALARRADVVRLLDESKDAMIVSKLRELLEAIDGTLDGIRVRMTELEESDERDG